MRGRAWITGTGAIAASGRSPGAILDQVLGGRSAIATLAEEGGEAWPVRVAGAIRDFDPRLLVADRKRHKLLRRTDFLGLFAASEAVRASAVAEARRALAADAAEVFDDETAVYVGSGGGAYRSQYEFLDPLAAAGDDSGAFARLALDSVSPMWLLQSLPNNVLCHVGIEHGFKGPNACFTTHTVSGFVALGEALSVLRAGEAERALVVAHDAPIEPESVGHLHRLGLLGGDAIRPFDAEHGRTLLGEGAAALFLESEASAAARGAPVLGELLGVGLACEDGGLLPVGEDGAALRRAIEQALEDAGVAPEDLGLVVAHGNGLPASDDSEAKAMHVALGSACPPISAFKWAHGHPMAASLLDAVIGLEASRRGVAPGIATLRSPSAAAAGLPLSAAHRPTRGPLVLALARGFAGTNAALVFRTAGAGES